MVIKAIIDRQYGNERIFVTNKEQREAIKQLTGRATLIQNPEKGIDHVQALRTLGHDVQIIDPLEMIEE